MTELQAERAQKTLAVPRIEAKSRRRRYVDVLMSGAASAIWNGFRRIKAA